MSQKQRQARNWAEYNKSLIKRGAVNLWIDQECLSTWYEPSQPGKEKRGHPLHFSNTAILCLLSLKYIYKLSLRATQGFALSLLQLMKLDLEIVSYSQLS